LNLIILREEYLAAAIAAAFFMYPALGRGDLAQHEQGKAVGASNQDHRSAAQGDTGQAPGRRGHQRLTEAIWRLPAQHRQGHQAGNRSGLMSLRKFAHAAACG